MKEIGYVLYAYLTDFAKLWLILWGIMSFQPAKVKKVYAVSVPVQVILMIAAGFFYPYNQDLITIFCTVLIIVMICFYFQGSFFKKFAYSLLAYALALFLDTCIVGLSSLLANMSGHEVIHYSMLRFAYNAVNILTILIIILLKKPKRRTGLQINISTRIYALLFAGAATGILILAALLVRSNDEATESARRAMVIATMIAILTYNAACLMIIIITESRDNYKSLTLISQNIIESQQEYYSLVNEKQQEMRSIRHEMKNHLSCICSLYQADKLQEMEEYITQLVDASSPEVLFDTGNDIVNAILNDAQSRQRKEGILIRLEGGFPDNLVISPMDLCVIFANTVSNAVEAIKRIPREEEDISYIDISIKSFKEDIFIDILNPVDKNVEINNKMIPTSKNDKSLHGFGIKNVIQRVKKYNGCIDFKCENNTFSVEINLKNKV
jgi:hypothetical protein